MESSESLPSAPANVEDRRPRRWWRAIRRESAEAGAVILDALFHPAAHFMALAALLGGLLILPMTGVQGWFPGCSFLRVTGLPCPGCGLTRSVVAAFRGDLATAWALNPLGILFALLFLLLGVLVFLPPSMRRRLRQAMKGLEAWTAFLTLAFLLLLLGHGFLRIGLVHFGHPSFSWWQDERGAPAQVDAGQSRP